MNGFSELTLDEMMGVDGGSALAGGATLCAGVYLLGKNIATPYNRTVHRRGETHRVSYTPSKTAQSIGKGMMSAGEAGLKFIGSSYFGSYIKHN